MKNIKISMNEVSQEAMISLAMFLKTIGFVNADGADPDYILYDLSATLKCSVTMYKSRTKDVGTITLGIIKE